MSSSSDLAGLIGAPELHAGAEATVELWERRGDGVAAVPYVAALTGADPQTLADAAAISVAGSPEAAHLLEGMGARIRMLNTAVSSSAERCEYAVRGPVLWAETITARANSLGSDDVFVCSTARRTFETVENRLLVAALESMAAALRAIAGPLGSQLTQDEATRVAKVAEEAQRWRRHPRLVSVRAGRITPRDTARLRGGHRLSRMGPILAVRRRATEPFDAADVARLADDDTRALHRFAAMVLGGLEQEGGAPDVLAVEEGAILGRGWSFRHPAGDLTGAPGVRYRGVPLLPPEGSRGDSRWWAAMPARSITIDGERDVARLLERLAARDRERTAERSGRRLPQRSASPSAYSSSSSSE